MTRQDWQQSAINQSSKKAAFSFFIKCANKAFTCTLTSIPHYKIPFNYIIGRKKNYIFSKFQYCTTCCTKNRFAEFSDVAALSSHDCGVASVSALCLTHITVLIMPWYSYYFVLLTARKNNSNLVLWLALVLFLAIICFFYCWFFICHTVSLCDFTKLYTNTQH